jgi:RNA polymerase sigma factor, sigma-70 family
MSQNLNIDELSLVRGCQRKDNGARRELYEKFSGQLMGVGLRYVGNRDVAQDLLHDCFIVIFNSIGNFTYRGDGSLKGWLKKVMINEALKYLRKNSKIVEVPLDTVPEVSDEEADVNDIPSGVLLNMIRALPDGYRTVLNLYVFEDKSHKEIAELLNISEHTSSSQFFRAKKMLVSKIKEYRRHEERR